MALTCRPPQRPQAVLAAAGQVGKSDGAARSRICLSVKPFANTLHILNATNQEYDHRDWKSKQSPHIPQEDVIFANETYRIEELRDEHGPDRNPKCRSEERRVGEECLWRWERVG